MSSISTTAAFVLLILCALYCNGFLLDRVPPAHLPSALYQENSLLENIQLLLLLASCLTFAVHAARSTHKTGRLILLAATLLCFTFIVRESDLRPFGVPAAITWFSDGPGRYVLLSPPWLALLWVMRRQHRQVRRQMRLLLLSAAGVPLAASILLLATGILFDQGVIRLAPSRYYEELCELNSYFFLLLTALASGARSRKTARTVADRA